MGTRRRWTRRLGILTALVVLAPLMAGPARARGEGPRASGAATLRSDNLVVRPSSLPPDSGGDACSGDVRPGKAHPGRESAATAGSTATRLPAPRGAAARATQGADHPDFNGDGFADLAISVTCEDVGAVADAGAVNVIYGGPNGLDASAGPGNQWWTQDSPGILDQAEPSDQFGHVMTPGDFNGDGYDDLAVASREDLEGTPTIADAGAVNVIYGGPNGLDATAGPGNQFWSMDSPGVAGSPARGDLWGRALAAGDFNRDGFQDLAVAAPNKTVAGQRNAGTVTILYGSSSGLMATGSQLWTQNSPGILDQSEENDQFGRALSAADFNGDGYLDLAIGPRHETLEGPPLISQAGAVNVIYGGPNGLDANAGPGNQFFTQDTPGIAGDGSQQDDWWGRPLKSGDFNGDGFADLAIGAFLEDFGSLTDAGAVTILYGSSNGLDVNAGPGSQWFTQDSSGILDHAESVDWFSRWDAVADFNGDGYADLVCGEPGEDLGSGQSKISNAGAINVIYGGPNGLQAGAGPGNQFWDQDSTGILDQAEAHDWFGHGNLVGADFNGDGTPDLAIGVIFEDIEGSPTIVDAGAVNVIYGGLGGLAAGAGPGNQLWTENSPGIAGDGAEFSDVYGGTLAAPGGD